MTKEALKLALEAYLCREMPAGTVIGDPKWWVPKIANAIKEALAQPEQEPVACVVPHGATMRLEWASVDAAHNAKIGPLYTTPPQRTWVGLSDEEIKMLIPEGDGWKYEVGFTEAIKFARAIEAAHGIKGAA